MPEKGILVGSACLSSFRLEAELRSLRPVGQAPLSFHPSGLAREGRSYSASKIALIGKGALSPPPKPCLLPMPLFLLLFRA